jgi:hypothetical protein
VRMLMDAFSVRCSQLRGCEGEAEEECGRYE